MLASVAFCTILEQRIPAAVVLQQETGTEEFLNMVA